jgi:hypothetical protein
MRRPKSILLGGAAVISAVSAAQSADLPVKARPVEYVNICSLYGEGFFYIPGTDTCLKIGGWVRYDTYFNQSSGDNPPTSSDAGLNTRSSSSDYSSRSRTVVSFDARSQTEYGTLRAYYRGGFELTTALASQYANGTYFYERAFIQLGGWTFGRSQSFFDIFASPWSYGGHYLVAGSYTSTYGTNLAAYTAQYGNGVSATLAIEDGNVRRTAIWDATSGPSAAGLFPAGDAYSIGSTSIGPMGPATNGYTTCGVKLDDNNDNTNGNSSTSNGLQALGCGWGDYAAQQAPDIVGNLRVDQPWGSAQVSGALHQLRANYYGNNFVVASPTFTGVAPSSLWGGAVNAGIMLNLPWNPGDKLWAEASYAVGAPSYVGFGQNTDNNGGFARYDGAFLANGVALDAVFANNAIMPMSGLQLSTAWSATVAVEHYWTPALRTSLFGSYAFWTPGSTGNVLMCSSPKAPIHSVAANAAPTGDAVLAGCNFDFASWGFGSRTIWSPVKNLDIGVEVLYQQIDQNMDPSQIRWNYDGSGTRPKGLYIPANEGAWAGMVRVQRNFYP